MGGIGSLLSGGKFGHGFFSAGTGSSLGLKINANVENAFGKVVLRGIVGGTVSKVTGGKFANGATSSAFSAAVSADWRSQSSTQNTNVYCNGQACDTRVDTAQLVDVDPELAALWRDDLISQGELALSVLNTLGRHSVGLDFSPAEYSSYALFGLELGAAAAGRWALMSASEGIGHFGLFGESLSLAAGVDGSAAYILQQSRVLTPHMRVLPAGNKARLKVDSNGKYIVE